MSSGEIDFLTLEVGKQYQYEEKYYVAAKVTVLEMEKNPKRHDGCDVDATYQDGDFYLKLKLRIDEIIFGKVQVGEDFTVAGYIKGQYTHYRPWKMKPVGSMTDYYVAGDYLMRGSIEK